MQVRKVGLSDQVYEQAIRYAEDLKAIYVIISDGNEISCIAREEKSNIYYLQDGTPTYDEMINRERQRAEIEEELSIRTDLSSDINLLEYRWCIGADTSSAKHKHIINLAEAFLDCSHEMF